MKMKVLSITLAGLLGATAAQAFQFEVTDEIKGSLDTQATAGFGLRTGNPNPNMVGDKNYNPNANTAQWSNGDDGNLNYREGNLFSTYAKLTPELLMQFPSRFKMMARGTMLYDFKATDTKRSDLTDDAEEQVARDLQLLDLWVSKEFNAGDQTARVRVGNQVISWGESIFGLGGINSTNALDIQKLMIPGTQLKEAVIPAPMVSFSTGLGSGLSVEAYYQFAWNRNRMPASGTYWSVGDGYDKGRRPTYLDINNSNRWGVDGITDPDPDHFINVVTGEGGVNGPPIGLVVPWTKDNEAKNDGQYGVALHYKPEGLQLDLGLYFMNYHDKMPVLYLNNGSGGQWNFLENRQLYGVSANFPVGNWAVGWELSYRPKEAVALSACGNLLADGTVDTNPFDQVGCKGWKDEEKYQSHLTGLLMLTPGDHGWLLNLLGADSGFFLGEVVGTYFPGLKNKYASGITKDSLIPGGPTGVPMYQVPAAGYYPWLADTTDPNSSVSQTIPGVGSEYSMGYTVDFNWTYDGSVIPGWQVIPGATFFHAVAGDTPTMLNNYAEGAKSLNTYLLFNMNPATWQAGLNYAMYFGGKSGQYGGANSLRQPLADRDFIGGFVTYNF